MATGVMLEELMSSPVIMQVISRIRTPQSRLQNFFGFGLTGGNTNNQGGRNFAFDVFDKTRNILSMRSPGTNAATIAPNPAGVVTGVFPRMAVQMRLPYEKIWYNRPLGGNFGMVDQGGQSYITKQEEFFAQLFINTREFMLSRALRGSFQLVRQGDDWIPVDSGGTFTIDFQIPAGNKSKLNMLGAGDILAATWANAGTDIFGHILSINAAFEQLHGYPLKHVWCTSPMWAYVLNNTGIKGLAGTSNTPFASFDRVDATGPDGVQTNEFTAVLRGIPWLQWHIYDGGLNVGTTPTFSKLVDDTHCIFLPDPDRGWMEMLNGSEPVVEADGGNVVNAMGFHAWSRNVTNPASVELNGVDNCIPAIYQPKCIAYGLTVY